MISSKDKVLRTRLNRKRQPPAIDHAQRPFRRWIGLLTVCIVLLGASGYWWLNSGAKGKADRQTVSLKPDSSLNVPSAVQRLRQAELARNADEIERALLSLIELDRGNSKWLMQLCDFYFSLGRWSAATETFTANINRNFPPQEAYQLQGTMLNALIDFGQPAEARSILDPLLSLSTGRSLEVVQMEARLLRLEGKSQEALNALKSVVLENHEKEHLHKLTGILEFDLGHYDRAWSSLMQADRLNPYSDSTQFKLAECARLMGDKQAERQHRDKYAQLHAIQQELSSLKTRLEQSETWTDAEALRLAELYESLGQTQQASFCKQQVEARRNHSR